MFGIYEQVTMASISKANEIIIVGGGSILLCSETEGGRNITQLKDITDNQIIPSSVVWLQSPMPE